MGEGREGRCRREGGPVVQEGGGGGRHCTKNVLQYVRLHSSDLNSRVQSSVLLRWDVCTWFTAGGRVAHEGVTLLTVWLFRGGLEAPVPPQVRQQVMFLHH